MTERCGFLHKVPSLNALVPWKYKACKGKMMVIATVEHQPVYRCETCGAVRVLFPGDPNLGPGDSLSYKITLDLV